MANKVRMAVKELSVNTIRSELKASKDRVTTEDILKRLVELTEDKKYLYKVDFQGINSLESSLALTTLAKRNAVIFCTGNQDVRFVLGQELISNCGVSPDKLPMVVKMRIQAPMHGDHSAPVPMNTIKDPRVERIANNNISIIDNICYVEYKYPVEVSTEMIDLIEQALMWKLADAKKTQGDDFRVTQVWLRLRIISINYIARQALWALVHKAYRDPARFCGCMINIDTSVIHNSELEKDLKSMMTIRHLDIQTEERVGYFSRLPRGMVCLWETYRPRTESNGNVDSVSYRSDEDIVNRKLVVFEGVEQDDTNRIKLTVLKKPVAGLERLPSDTEMVDVSEIGYDIEFLGNKNQLLRLHPDSYETVKVVRQDSDGIVDELGLHYSNSEVIVYDKTNNTANITDAIYAKKLLDKYQITYNADELANDIARSTR